MTEPLSDQAADGWQIVLKDACRAARDALDNRDRLVAEIMRRPGRAGLRVHQIAEAAGVSVQTVYRLAEEKV